MDDLKTIMENEKRLNTIWHTVFNLDMRSTNYKDAILRIELLDQQRELLGQLRDLDHNQEKFVKFITQMINLRCVFHRQQIKHEVIKLDITLTVTLFIFIYILNIITSVIEVLS